MELNLKQLKQIEISYRDLIWGYCKEIGQPILESRGKYHEIPPIIKYKCLAFYYTVPESESSSEFSNNFHASQPSSHSTPIHLWRPIIRINSISSKSSDIIDNSSVDLSNNNSISDAKAMLIRNLWNGKYSKRTFKIAMAANII